MNVNLSVRPAPFPDEIDLGYQGRVMRLNGLVEEKEALDSIAQQFSRDWQSRRECPAIELLALIAGQPLEMFIHQHSMIPLTRAIVKTTLGTAPSRLVQRTLLSRLGVGSARAGAHFCVKCVSEDVGFHGTSYWRRAHQVPGQVCCPKHLIPLRSVKDEAAFLKPPSRFLNDADVIQESELDQAKNHPLVMRSMEIAAGLMVRAEPLDSAIVGSTLRAKAMALGFRTSKDTSEGKLLLDQIYEEFPRDWLISEFCERSWSNKRLRFSMGNLGDFPDDAGRSVWTYVFTAAVLYETADEAITDLTNAKVAVTLLPKEKTRKPLEKKPKYKSTTGDLAEHALSQAMNRVTPEQKLRVLGKIGLEKRNEDGGCGIEAYRAMKAFYVEGKTIAESADEAGISNDEMESLVRRVGGNLASVVFYLEKKYSEKLPTKLNALERASAMMCDDLVG